MSLRMAVADDAAQLLAIYSYYVENTSITFEYETPSLEEFQARIRTILEKFPYIVAEEDGKILGYAYASSFKERAAYDWTVEWSVYLDKEARSKGLGQKLYDKLTALLRQQNVVTIEACITYPNEKSIRFHQKNGFKEVAHFNKVGYKLGKWHDVVWYEKTLCPPLDQPEPVKCLKDTDGLF
ncbi:N-acetyltransferase family protein [Streptococcus dentiloxodontae]